MFVASLLALEACAVRETLQPLTPEDAIRWEARNGPATAETELLLVPFGSACTKQTSEKQGTAIQKTPALEHYQTNMFCEFL